MSTPIVNLNVRVLSPKEIIFQSPALSVSSKNLAGKFDILPFHAKFISFIEKQPIVIKTLDKKNHTFKFPFAIIYNNNNSVDIYTEISLPKID